MNKIQKALTEIEKAVNSGRLPSAMTASDLMTAYECVCLRERMPLAFNLA